MISPARLAEIKARAQRATPGPWRLVAHYSSSANVAAMRSHDGALVEAGPCIACGVDQWEGEEGSAPYLNDDDGPFVAHARQDVPDLVAEVERLRAVERALRGELTARFDRSAAKAKGRALGIEEAVDLLRELAEDARDDGNGSDDEVSTALDDAAEAVVGLAARDPDVTDEGDHLLKIRLTKTTIQTAVTALDELVLEFECRMERGDGGDVSRELEEASVAFRELRAEAVRVEADVALPLEHRDGRRAGT